MSHPNLERKVDNLSQRVDALQEIIVEMLRLAADQDPHLFLAIEQRLEKVITEFDDTGYDGEASAVGTVLGDFIGRPS